MAADEHNSAATGRAEGQEERLAATNGAAPYAANGSISGEDNRLPGAVADSDDEDVDVAMALLALEARGDMGEPTADLDLSSLSDADKRMLLAMLRKRLGLTETGNAATASDAAAASAARRGSNP